MPATEPIPVLRQAQDRPCKRGGSMYAENSPLLGRSSPTSCPSPSPPVDTKKLSLTFVSGEIGAIQSHPAALVRQGSRRGAACARAARAARARNPAGLCDGAAGHLSRNQRRCHTPRKPCSRKRAKP